jgi:hypothetical protein
VVSTAISRGGPKHANENEHLRHKRAAQTKPG